MEANPYAKFLAGRDPMEIIASTAAELTRMSALLPLDRIRPRNPSCWGSGLM